MANTHSRRCRPAECGKASRPWRHAKKPEGSSYGRFSPCRSSTLVQPPGTPINPCAIRAPASANPPTSPCRDACHRRLGGEGWSFGSIRPKPQMTENMVECAVAARETERANSATRHFARSRRARGANWPRGLRIRPRFRSFAIQLGAPRIELRAIGLQGRLPHEGGGSFQKTSWILEAHRSGCGPMAMLEQRMWPRMAEKYRIRRARPPYRDGPCGTSGHGSP